MDQTAPNHRATVTVKVGRDPLSRNKVATLDEKSRDRVQAWNATVCVYVIVRNDTIQYVGCSSRNFFQRFSQGLKQVHAKGYRWPTTGGRYKLFVWKTPDQRSFAEALEAEVAFLHRAVLGDWPIELNQVSPKRHLVQKAASAFGKSMAFEIFAWLMQKKHIVSTDDDFALLKQLHDRSVIC